ncbi:Transposable element Tc3 transposase [Araneus ventricosus]|uniref:Transposable element Tc3 transposase n=1 Tax=Araneus ventricosus TaxID=182803 RepID=A0A4Y2IF15_ARAVE|nr:Transposable element Tc3 transposase [Araneus ventricosus]
MSWTTEWTSVIFSDEKRFNLDGPDGFQYYWHCLKQKEQYYSTRQQGGGSLVVWLAVGFGGRSSLVFIKGRQNHKDYIKQLETELLPCGSDWGGENWIHQQDGASIHSAQGVKKWLDDNNVQVFPWPAKSPDLNIVENVWAMLVERVYGQERQYENVKELHESLDSVWNTFCQKDIQNLYDSMPNRVFELIQAGEKYYELLDFTVKLRMEEEIEEVILLPAAILLPRHFGKPQSRLRVQTV